jgi:lysophospholipase L1-like esterase
MKGIAYIIVLCFAIVFVKGQTGDYYLGGKQYPFIQYNENKILFPGDSDAFERIYKKMDSLIVFGHGKINIVHIGGSHIQADIYTHQIRKQFQHLQHDLNGGRGLIFPYRVAKSNNPSNYKVSYSGAWEYCKNTQRNRDCDLGLNGYAITTKANSASLVINPNGDEDIKYHFNSVRVFHSPANYQLSVQCNGDKLLGSYDSISGCSVFSVPESNRLKINLSRIDTVPGKITIYGISLDNDDPGLVYNAIGVNGARLSSYIDSELYGQHMAAINPDLIIFSIGTNDANTRYFDYDKYKIEYTQLIEISKHAAPNAAILITVPNDCYYYKRYVNKNTPVMRNQIIKIAEEYNYGVWDFYSIMGGLNSSQTWYNYGLMRYDRIHFNRAGYILKGNLLLSAFLRGWEQNLTARTMQYFSDKTITADFISTTK